MQLIHFFSRGVHNLGRNRHTWSRHLGMQLICLLDQWIQIVYPQNWHPVCQLE